MKAIVILAVATSLAAAAGARAQDPHAGHSMPPSADPHAGHAASPPVDAADPHAAHRAPPAQDPEANPHAGHVQSPPPDPKGEPPPIPTDFDADRFFPKKEMDAARAQLSREHGRIVWSKVVFDTLEYRPTAGPDAYAWEGSASFGGDLNRLVLKSRGEGDRELERAEVEALWSRAVSPWFNLEAGVRQDLQRDGRTYGVLVVDGLAPYEFDLDAALFVSTHGDLSARIEASHDYRLTQRLILQPRGEVNLAASSVPSQEVGAGLGKVELGVRLRYAFTPEFAPYVGVEHERAFGKTERLMRAAGDDPKDTRVVLGVRAWF